MTPRQNLHFMFLFISLVVFVVVVFLSFFLLTRDLIHKTLTTDYLPKPFTEEATCSYVEHTKNSLVAKGLDYWTVYPSSCNDPSLMVKARLTTEHIREKCYINAVCSIKAIGL